MGDGELVGDAIGQRIAQVPHVALDLDILDFEIGNGGFEAWMPVDQALGAVDQAALVQLDEDLGDGPHHLIVGGALLAHGEALAGEVGRGTQALELVHDGAAALGLPFPDTLDELLATHFAAAGLLALHQLALDDHLGGDAGMVGARLPEHILAQHAIEADQDVLDGVVERVTDVERASDVGRRNDDGEGLGTLRRPCPGGEGVGLEPIGIDAAFDR
jgi:hypothetical protein